MIPSGCMTFSAAVLARLAGGGNAPLLCGWEKYTCRGLRNPRGKSKEILKEVLRLIHAF